MGITTVREFPTDLPHARLFLDDVEEVVGILTKAYEKHWNENIDGPLRVGFSVGDRQADSIDDLETLGGGATDFTIGFVGTPPIISVGHSLGFRPRVLLFRLPDEVAWSTYGKLKAIFDRRQMALKNALLALPEWFKWGGLWFLLMFPLLLSWLGAYLHLFANTGWAILFLWVVSVATTGCIALRPSRVYFVRSHAKTRLQRERSRTYLLVVVTAAISVTVGAVLSPLLGLAVQKLVNLFR